MSERWLAAMSGGVDSSVAAALLVRDGCEVVGVTMDLGGAPAGAAAEQRCCGLPEVEDARAVARALGIRHYTANYRSEFRAAVIEPFLRSYAQGRTPIPCIDCNRVLKFDLLLRRADALESRGVATGHYARIAPGPDGEPSLFRALDREKDQTYFLFDLPRAALRRIRFPLGELTKPQVRAIARELELVTAEKPESQGICFAPEGDVREALARLEPERAREAGEIVDGESGRVLGRHLGAAGYTVGQRRGLDLPGGPWYVREVQIEANRVVVARERAALERTRVRIERPHWIEGAPPAEPVRAQIRYRHRAVSARVEPCADGTAWIHCEEPVWAPAPGQAAVVYDATDTRLLGGGWIGRC